MQDPLFVSRKMLDSVAEHASSLTIAASGEGVGEGAMKGKFFGPREEAAARLLPGPKLHDHATVELLRHLQG